MTKSTRAILASIKATDTGKLRLSLDDLVYKGGQQWVQDEAVTHKDYGKMEFENMHADDQALRALGLYVWARLHAFYERGEY